MSTEPRYVEREPATPQPVRLSGRRVILEPMLEAHIPALAAAHTPGLTQWYPQPIEPGEAGMTVFVNAALAEQAAGRAVPFTARLIDGRVVGTSRYGNIDRNNRRLEIGWTWFNPEVQGTGINVESKRLLLDHAFDTLNVLRVEFKADSLNRQSIGALTALGATQEGVFRQHVVCNDGRVRHSVYFSIIDIEWPAIRQRIEARLNSKEAS